MLQFKILNCKLIQIEQHPLKIIANDAYPIKPVIVDSAFSAAGERFDFVLKCQNPGNKLNYAMMVIPSGICQASNKQAYAVLSYDTTKTDEELSIPPLVYPDPPSDPGVVGVFIF